MEEYLNYDDVYMLPKFSEIKSRKDIDVSVKLGNLTLEVPIISANMDTVTESQMAIAVFKAGGIGALHRFMPISDNVEQYERVRNSNAECIVSIGVSDDYDRRAISLYKAGARYFLIDIAHGHSLNMKSTISFLKEHLEDIFIIAGNVGTIQGVEDLREWGADIVKVGIAGGKVCITKDVTGVHTPMFTTIQKCGARSIPIIADGGIKTSGDVAKAIAAGATYVMSGFLFSSCVEAPHAGIYRGMASREAMERIKSGDLPTPEGKTILVDINTTAEHVVNHVRDGLRSSLSYAGATNIQEFKDNVEFIRIG